jgi:hypothetical protein
MYQTRFQFPTKIKILAYSQNEANKLIKQTIQDFNSSYGSSFKLVNFKAKGNEEVKTPQTFDLDYKELLHLAKQENYQELENQFDFWFLNDYSSEDRRHIC